MASKTLHEIASYVGGELIGNPDIRITGIAGLKEAKEGDLSFLANRRYVSLLDQTQASAVLIGADVDYRAKPVIRCSDPSLAFGRAAGFISPCELRHPEGIHPSAVIARSAKIGHGVAVGAGAVIDEDVVIGSGTIIYPGCFVGHESRIGTDCVFFAHVAIRERVVIGDRVRIQSGSVIGSEGFGYVKVDGKYELIPQVGTVVIEDDVEIGANVTIDRARFDKTLIGRGTKIDNLVQIAHNVTIGENSIIVAQAGISGSTRIGKNVTIAGQAGLVGHIEIGDGAVLAAQAGIISSVPPQTMVSGYPAREHHQAMRLYASLERLPELIKTVNALKKKLGELEDRLKESGD